MNTMTKVALSEAGKMRSSERGLKASGAFSRKDEYRAFCDWETSLPIFARDWWLDAAVGPHNWDVALVSSSVDKGTEVLMQE